MQRNIFMKVKAAAFMLAACLSIIAFSAVSANAQSSNGSGTYVNDGMVLQDKNGDQYTARRLQKTVDGKVDDSQNSAAFKSKNLGQYFSRAFKDNVSEAKGVIDYYKDNDVSAIRIAGDAVVGGINLGQKVYNGIFDISEQVGNSALDGMRSIGLSPVADGLEFAAKYTLKPMAEVSRFIGNFGFGVAKTVASTVMPTSNVNCRQSRMDAIYKSDCYPCKIIKAMLSAFVNGVNVLNDIMVEAAKKILMLCFLLWVVFYVLKQLSSLKNLEPAAMVNDMLIMAFKVLGAWILISGGFKIFVSFVVVPILGWGVDFGTYILSTTSSATGISISGNQVAESYMLSPSAGEGSFMPTHLLNNLMTYIAAVDGTVTTHMKIGHMITCHSLNMGQWVIMNVVKVGNVFTWVCGAAIWFMGFMMTFAVLFYLVDVAFKIGFAIVSFPILMSLWPFSLTTDKIKSAAQLILHSAGVFIFLAMTASLGLVLVNSALSVPDMLSSGEVVGDGITKLFTEIEKGNDEYISDNFSLFSTMFLLLVFAYLYAFKIINSTNQEYVNKFFDSMLSSSQPIHGMMVGGVGLITDKVKSGVGLLKDIGKHQSALALDNVMGILGNKEKRKEFFNKFKSTPDKMDKLTKGKFDEALQEKEEKSKLDSAQSMTNMKSKDIEQMERKEKQDSGSATENAGEEAAKAVDAAGDGLKESGKAVKDGARAAADAQKAAGDTAAAAGDAAALPTAGTSAVVGHTVQAATYTSGTATQAAGEAAGTTMEVGGEVMKKTATAIKQASKIGKQVQKMANKTLKDVKKMNEQQRQKGSSNEEKEDAPNAEASDNDLITMAAKGAAKGAIGDNKKK